MNQRAITVSSTEGVVCSVDHHAGAAGVEMLRRGGNAVDAAIATSAALAVTTQHMCGLGGDLFALVHHAPGSPDCLNASGRAGSGANPDSLRSQGHTQMPFRDDIRSVPIPGCVDGWVTLHERHGTLPLAELLEPAILLATAGFEIPNHLEKASLNVADVAGADTYQDLTAGHVITRPDIARWLELIATQGREGWYLGDFGKALVEVGGGEYVMEDLKRSQADWVQPLEINAWGHTLWTTPPNSQGYLTLVGAGILQGVTLPAEESPDWVHLHVEAARLAAYDRPEVLSESADGPALIAPEVLSKRRANLDANHKAKVTGSYRDGGTIYLCTTDSAGMGVSLIQSNAAGFGSHVVVPGTGVFLHNRGMGFSLIPGHPAEYGPGRRPPHTLSPAVVTRPDGSLRTVLGTMGGDAQPQIVLQMLSRLLASGVAPDQVLSRPRWVLESPDSDGFHTWDAPNDAVVVVEPPGQDWVQGLKAKGHAVECRKVNVGHAHLIDIDANGVQHGAAEPRISTAAALGND